MSGCQADSTGWWCGCCKFFMLWLGSHLPYLMFAGLLPWFKRPSPFVEDYSLTGRLLPAFSVGTLLSVMLTLGLPGWAGGAASS